MFEISVDKDFDFSSELYRDLYNRSNATAFQHPYWMQAMQQKLVTGLARVPAILQIKTADSGLLIGLIPLVERPIGPFRILEYANFGVVDHVSAVIDRDFFDPLLGWSGLAGAVEDTLGAYDLVWIKHVREQELWLKAFFGDHVEAREAGFCTYATELGDNLTAWKQSKLSANRRSDLKRKRAKLAKAGKMRFQLLSAPDEMEKAFEFLRKMRADRFADAEGKDFLQDPLFFDFYNWIGRDYGEQGYAVMACLYLDGAIAAAAFGIKDRGTYKFLLPGADYENFGRYSPGKVLIDHMIESLIEKDITTFDFSVGDEEYKASFGTTPEKIYTLRGRKSLAGWAGLKLIDLIKKHRMANKAPA